MSELSHIREVILRYGWNATAYQLVNPGIDHWHSRRHDAVIGYVRRHGVRVVAGAPVCALELLPEVIGEWERLAAERGERVCYFGAGDRVESLLGESRGYSTVVLGAQPVWDPNGWNGIICRNASLRAQLHRARNKGVAVIEWAPERATGHPELQRCLRE